MKLVVEGRDHVLEAGQVRIRLLKPHGMFARATGLLNHLSLAEDEGLIFGRSVFFHTFGMRFPILVLSLSGSGEQVAEPRIVPPGKLFVSPWRAAHCIEAHPAHHELFFALWRRQT